MATIIAYDARLEITEYVLVEEDEEQEDNEEESGE